jgi:hypothetical protein
MGYEQQHARCEGPMAGHPFRPSAISASLRSMRTAVMGRCANVPAAAGFLVA